jgi:hypothetical protein
VEERSKRRKIRTRKLRYGQKSNTKIILRGYMGWISLPVIQREACLSDYLQMRLPRRRLLKRKMLKGKQELAVMTTIYHSNCEGRFFGDHIQYVILLGTITRHICFQCLN